MAQAIDVGEDEEIDDEELLRSELLSNDMMLLEDEILSEDEMLLKARVLLIGAVSPNIDAVMGDEGSTMDEVPMEEGVLLPKDVLAREGSLPADDALFRENILTKDDALLEDKTWVNTSGVLTPLAKAVLTEDDCPVENELVAVNLEVW